MDIAKRFDLSGRVALVTGAGSGIGRAYAQGLAEAGAAVACVDISGDRADLTAMMITGFGGRALAVVADVAQEADVERMVEETVAGLGRLDIAFANAGVVVPQSRFPDTSLADWQRSIDINLTGVWLTIRAVSRYLLRQGQGGSIVTTASIYGLVGSFEPSSGSYQAAKGGVVNLTRDLAALLAADQIRVNAIAPGFIRTNLGTARLLRREGSTTSELEMEVIRRTPLGRVGEPEDLIGMALFLASDASSFVTGAVIPVDGGWLTL